ncbi:hypothetical protein BH23ACT8_BH23ACT8_03790 [soil metagenome]
MLLGALCAGVFTYLVVGYLTGNGPRARVRRRSARPVVSPGQLWLTQAGLVLTPAQFWAGSAVLGCAAFAMVTMVTTTPAAAVVPAVCAALLPRWLFARRRAQRLHAVQRAWPDGLRELVAAVTAGMSLPQALTALSVGGPEPLREAFARFGVLARVLGVVPALEVIKEELADPTSDRVIEILVIAHQRGGRLVSEVLRDLADATTIDVRTAEEIETNALEQKLNARAVFALPWFVLFVLTSRAGPFRDFYQSSGGVAVVGVAVLASLGGLWVVNRLGAEPLEERVLGSAAGQETGP